jgi:hypothetical protein
MRNIAATLWRGLLAGFAAVRIFVPLALVALLLTAYAWWWQEVAGGVRAAAGQFKMEQRALNREAQWDALEIGGFPYRVEARFAAPHLTAPDRGFAWDGKTLALRVQPLRPHHIAFDFQGHQHLLYAKDGRLIEGDIDANQALVNVVVAATGIAEIGLEVEGLSGRGAWDGRHIELVVRSASANARASQDEEASGTPIAIEAKLDNVALRGDLVLPLGPAIALVALKARLRLPIQQSDAPIPDLVAAWRATNTPLEIDEFQLDWGGVTVAAYGALELDRFGRPEGRLQLKIGNHKRLVEVMTAEGWISAEAQANVMTALNTLAFVSGDKERRVDVSLRLSQGSAFLELFGLVPIRMGPVAPIIPPPPPIVQQG